MMKNGEILKRELRTMIRGTYDIQKLRIQMGNRIVGNFKAKLGEEPSKSEKELSVEAKKILDTLRATYKRITDKVKAFPKQEGFEGDEVISNYTELCLMAQCSVLGFEIAAKNC